MNASHVLSTFSPNHRLDADGCGVEIRTASQLLHATRRKSEPHHPRTPPRHSHRLKADAHLE